METKRQWVELGRLGREWGLKGHLKCISFNSESDLFSSIPCLYLKRDEVYQKILLESARVQGKDWLLKFKGVDSPEAAQEYRGLLVALPREDLPDLQEDECYLVDLEGFNVLSPEGKSLGQVLGFQQVGSSEVMQVGATWQDSVGVPYLPDFVVATRREEREIQLSELAMDFFEIS